MNTILVPIDFSKCSVYGLELAANLARKTKAKLYILNVVPTDNFYYAANPVAPASAVMLTETTEALKKESFQNLNKLLKKNFLSGLRMQIFTMEGNSIHEEIINYANKVKADIIIMGTHGSSGLKGMFLGSTAERVVRFSERPVIVVPAKVKDMDFKEIVFASDFKSEAYSVFPIIKNFAGIYRAKIHLLKVNIMEHFSRSTDNLQKMREFCRHYKHTYPMSVYDDYSIEEGILNFAKEYYADMIAIGTHGKKGLSRFFKSDVSEDTLRLTEKPILILNFNESKHKSDLVYEEEAEDIIL